MNRILIVRLSSLGDIVHGIPVAAALRDAFPSARIDWLVHAGFREVCELVTCIDDVIAVDPRGGRGEDGLWNVIRRLRRSRYDAAVDVQGLLKSGFMARASGARRVIGFPSGHLREKAAALFYTERCRPGPYTHVIEKNLGLLAALGAATATVRFPLRVPPAPSWADRPDVAVLHPGANWPNKRWPAERMGRLAGLLRARLGLHSLVLDGPRDGELAAAVVEASSGSAAAAGRVPIGPMAAVLHRARVVVGGDSGPLHVAAALGTPVVGLFGPTDPARNGPWSSRDRVVSRYPACRCPFRRRCRARSWCMSGISEEEVASAVESRLAVHAR